MLDLGVLVARATLDTAEFDAGYVRTSAKLRGLSDRALRASAGLLRLDEALASAGKSASSTAVGLDRTSRAAASAAAGEDRAAAAAEVHARSLRQVTAVLQSVAGESTKVQAATLRVTAAQERLTAVQESGTATTRQLASAQASLLASQRSLTNAQAGSIATQDAAVASTGRWRTSLAETAAMVGKATLGFGALGLAIGAVEAVKGASNFQRSMLAIQTQAGATAAEVKSFSAALLTLGPKVATGPEDLSVSLYHVYSALKKVGASGPQMLNAVKIAAEGAKVGNTNLEDTTNSLTATLASGIVRFDQASKAMGYLNAIVGAGDMKFSDLNQALGTGLLVTMKTFGVSLQDSGAALAVFGDNNIRGADAATKLRMSVQDLAKPAAHADDYLKTIGLSADELRAALTQHGLNDALTLLKTHLDAAGVTGSKVGGFLEDAFTKKAGTGLAILITRLKQFDEARTTEQRAAGSFGSAWQATTRTLSHQFDRIKAAVEAAGISLGEKMLPAVTTAARWIGTSLPRAFSNLWKAVQPTVSMIGTGLVEAWKVLGPVVRFAASALGDFGRLLSHQGATIKAFVIVLGTMWAAFKGFTIVRAVLIGLPSLISAIAEKFFTANLAAQQFAGGWGTLAAGAVVLTGAITAVTMALNANQQHQAAVAADLAEQQARVDALTEAFQKDSGAIGENTRALVEQRLQSAHMYDLADKIGVSYKTMTQAALGFAPAQKTVNQAMIASGQISFVNTGLLAQNRAELGRAHRAWQQQTEVQKEYGHQSTVTATTAQNLGNTMQDQVPKYFAITTVTDKLRTATQVLKGALLALDGVLNSAASEVAYQQGLKDLTKTFKDNKNAIDGNSTAALADRAAFISQAQQIVQNAQAMRDHGASVQKVTGYLRTHIAELKEAAIKAGEDKSKVDDLTTSLGLVPSVIRSEILMDTRTALQKVAYLEGQIKTLGQNMANADTAGSMSLNTTPQKKPGRASGGGLPEGWSSVGEGGAGARPELVHKSGSTVQVYSNAQSRAIVHATGMIAPGFAGGTVRSQVLSQVRDPRTRLAMLMAPYLEGGGPSPLGSGGWGVGDKGTSFGPYQIHLPAHPGVSAREARDPAFAVRYMKGAYRAAVASVGGGMWASHPAMAARLAIFRAERPTSIYGASAAAAAYRAVHRLVGGPGGGGHGGHGGGSGGGGSGSGGSGGSGGGGGGGSTGSGGGGNGGGGGVVRIPGAGDNPPVVQRTSGGGVTGGTTIAKVPMDIYRVGKGFGWNGTYYAKHKDAVAARRDALHQAAAERLGPGVHHGHRTRSTVTDRIGGANGATGVAKILNENKPAAVKAMRDLAKAVNLAWDLKGVEKSVDQARSKLKDLRGDLATMRQYQSGVVSTYAGNFDPTQYGTVGGLIRGLHGQAGTNNNIAAQITRLRHEHLNKGYLNQLIQGNQTGLISILAGSNPAQIGRLNKALHGYNSSLRSIGTTAEVERFGKTLDRETTLIAKQRTHIDKLITREGKLTDRIDDLTDAVQKLTGRPVEISLDGKVIARSTGAHHAGGIRHRGRRGVNNG